MSLDWEDAIVACATSRGQGCRAIVRGSGPRSHAIAEACIAPATLRRQVQFTIRATFRLRRWDRSLPVMVYSWPQGRSYTGQESVEIHLPAGPALVDAVIEELIAHGARLARPGEFTLRAVLAGRMDLVQAEAVLGLIHAEAVEEARAAIDQRTGGISQPIEESRQELLDVLADLEAGLDFVEEDITFVSEEATRDRLLRVKSNLASLSTRLESRSISAGKPRVTLLGLSNAGKSSLFNAILRSDAAIVSPIVGTTRDYLVGEARVGEITFEIVDTAGIEESQEEIALAAARLRSESERHSDLIAWCVPIRESIPAAFAADAHAILVRTMCDRDPSWHDPSADCHVSVQMEGGINSLMGVLERRIELLQSSRRPMWGLRCHQSLMGATAAIDEAIDASRRGEGAEVVAVSIRETLDRLGEVVGSTNTDDLLGRVFAKFCIGK